jgi:hypothetical protein
MSRVACGSNITMAGGPETGPDGCDTTIADAATIGADLAAPVLDRFRGIGWGRFRSIDGLLKIREGGACQPRPMSLGRPHESVPVSVTSARFATR